MADYWKSQTRKYCEFCKCWIADNKPSREFHEKGRRHQENVAKKLKHITKKSRRDEKESLKTDLILRQIESAALEAYSKDVQTNGDLSSIDITNVLQQTAAEANSKNLWRETKGDDGKIYYYNVLTNETVWEKPKEGYLSIVEQQQTQDEATRHQLKSVNKQRILKSRLAEQQEKQEDDEARAKAAREKLKERRVSPDPIPEVCGPIIEPGKTDPYGKWQTVKTSETTMDLQLPKQEFEYFEIPSAQEPVPAPPKEFKERTVESLGEGRATFKKRKFVSGSKKNTRQRLDDD